MATNPSALSAGVPRLIPPQLGGRRNFGPWSSCRFRREWVEGWMPTARQVAWSLPSSAAMAGDVPQCRYIPGTGQSR
jgi:hypothetical protein